MEKKHEKKTIGIRYGALSESIATQLRQQGFKFNTKEVARFNVLKEYATHLRFAGLLPDAEYDRVLKRLHKQIVIQVEKNNP